MSRTIKPAKNQTTFAFDRRDRFRFLRGADFGDPAEHGRKNFAPLKRLIELIECKTAPDGATYLTQSEIADAWGVSRATVNRWVATGVALGVLIVEARLDRGGRRANRMRINWPAIRRFAYGGANPDDLGLSSNRQSAELGPGNQNRDTQESNRFAQHVTALSHDVTALSHDATTIKGTVRFNYPDQPPPNPPREGAVPPLAAYAAAGDELGRLGVRNRTRALRAARARGMTPDAVASILREFRTRLDAFDDPPAALVARLTDLDEFPPASEAARRRRADAAAAEAAAAAAERNRAAEQRRAERCRIAAALPTWAQLPDAERRRRISEQAEQFPVTPPRMLQRFAAASYQTERERAAEARAQMSE